MSLPTCPTCEYERRTCVKTGVTISHTTGCTFHTPKRISNGDLLRSKTNSELARYLWLESGRMTLEEWEDWLNKECDT